MGTVTTSSAPPRCWRRFRLPPWWAASQQVVDEAREQTEPAVLENWTSWFGDGYDHTPAIPAVLDSLDIRPGGPLGRRAARRGCRWRLRHRRSPTELDTVCSGDAVYNNIHMWLWNSTPESRAAWLVTIDAIAALQPATIIAGHRDPDAPDDAHRILAQSRRYVEDFDAALTQSTSAGQLIDTMMAVTAPKKPVHPFLGGAQPVSALSSLDR